MCIHWDWVAVVVALVGVGVFAWCCGYVAAGACLVGLAMGLSVRVGAVGVLAEYRSW